MRRSTSFCVHFVDDVLGELDIMDVESDVAHGEIRYVYLNCRELAPPYLGICDSLGVALGGQHAPYGELNYVRLLDDLITLSRSLPGMVIVIDGADRILHDAPKILFELIESFLLQFHHWYDKKKPCHLYLQLAPDANVTRIFRTTKGI